MDLDTYSDVVIDDDFRMICGTAETNTGTTEIVIISVFTLSAMNFPHTCHQSGAVARLVLTSVACL
jgi:hypothetical protein